MDLEELQKSFLELQDNLKKISEEKTSLEKRLEDIENKNKQLQDINHDLFLRVTTPTPVTTVEEKETVTTADIVDQYKKEHNI